MKWISHTWEVQHKIFRWTNIHGAKTDEPLSYIAQYAPLNDVGVWSLKEKLRHVTWWLTSISQTSNNNRWAQEDHHAKWQNSLKPKKKKSWFLIMKRKGENKFLLRARHEKRETRKEITNHGIMGEYISIIRKQSNVLKKLQVESGVFQKT